MSRCIAVPVYVTVECAYDFCVYVCSCRYMIVRLNRFNVLNNTNFTGILDLIKRTSEIILYFIHTNLLNILTTATSSSKSLASKQAVTVKSAVGCRYINSASRLHNLLASKCKKNPPHPLCVCRSLSLSTFSFIKEI